MSLRCAEVRDRQAAWLEGQLSPGDEEQVARHLAGCPRCAREVATLEGQVFAPPPVPGLERPDFWAPMDRALAEAWTRAAAPPPLPWWRREWRLSGAQLALLAAAFLVAVGLLGVQARRLQELSARAEALQVLADRQDRGPGDPRAALPDEPVAVAVHTPFRGSL